MEVPQSNRKSLEEIDGTPGWITASARMMSKGKDFTTGMTSPVDSVLEVRWSILEKRKHDRWQREAAVEAKSNDDW